MSELTKLKHLQAVSISSSSPAAASSGSEQSSSGSQMMMVQQMVNSGVDPFLGQSIVSGAGATSIESHPGQRSTESGLGQCTLRSIYPVCLLMALCPNLQHVTTLITGLPWFSAVTVFKLKWKPPVLRWNWTETVVFWRLCDGFSRI